MSSYKLIPYSEMPQKLYRYDKGGSYIKLEVWEKEKDFTNNPDRNHRAAYAYQFLKFDYEFNFGVGHLYSPKFSNSWNIGGYATEEEAYQELLASAKQAIERANEYMNDVLNLERTNERT